MSIQARYQTPQAFWRALGDRAKARAKQEATTSGDVLRQFVHERFLARIFADGSSSWVLKGGNAVLARVADARATLDVDLLTRQGNLENAHDQLLRDAATDLRDHFRFVAVSRTPTGKGQAQDGVGGEAVRFDAYCGSKRVGSVKVDLVTRSLMTTDPQAWETTELPIAGLEPTTLWLYPVVDHVADKVCATQATYGGGAGRSTRVRDLVDLVVFARTQRIDGASLVSAIASEWAFRNLPGKPGFDPPSSWSAQYGTIARGVPACGDTTVFSEAVALVSRLIWPACDGSVNGSQWNPMVGAWQPLH